MRTRYALMIAACTVTSVTHAQTLDNGNISPQPGESGTLNAVDYVTPGAGGANVTWDHSDLPAGTAQPFTYQTPASTGYGGSFPGATVAQGISSGSYAFFQGSAAGLDLLGLYTATIDQTIVYQNPERILSYPCSYNTTWTDALQSNFISLGFPVARSGSITGLADGYGTLIMPYGTVTNVLRVRTIEDYSDDVDGLYTADYLFTNHYYYKPGTHAPILVMYDQNTTIAGEVTVAQSAAWLANGPAGMMDAVRNDIGIDVFPNPATDLATVVFSSSGGALRMELIDATGRIVRNESLSGMAMGIERVDLDVNGLPAGLYQVRLSSTNGEQGVQRLVVQ